MKKTFFAAAAALAMVSCGNKDANSISGTLQGIESDSLAIEIYAVDNFNKPLRTVVVPVVEGKFKADVSDTVAREILIRNSDDKKLEKGYVLFAFIPGESAVLSGGFDDITYDGSGFFKDKKAYESLCADIKARIKQMSQDYDDARQAGDDTLAESIAEGYDALEASLDSITYEYIKANPGKDFSATLIGSLLNDDGKQAAEAIGLLSEKVKNGPLADVVASADVRAGRLLARSIAAEKVKDGMPAPDFTLKNQNGEDFTLSSIFNQGKYIILDFWGSWCIWCVKGIPDMKQLYSESKGKIEIVGIDCREDEEAWKEGIEKHQLPWLHVYNPGEEGNDLSLTYAIQGYPTKIVLNPDGTINKTIIGEDPEFYTYVRSLLK